MVKYQKEESKHIFTNEIWELKIDENRGGIIRDWKINGQQFVYRSGAQSFTESKDYTHYEQEYGGKGKVEVQKTGMGFLVTVSSLMGDPLNRKHTPCSCLVKTHITDNFYVDIAFSIKYLESDQKYVADTFYVCGNGRFDKWGVKKDQFAKTGSITQTEDIQNIGFVRTPILLIQASKEKVVLSSEINLADWEDQKQKIVQRATLYFSRDKTGNMQELLHKSYFSNPDTRKNTLSVRIGLRRVEEHPI